MKFNPGDVGQPEARLIFAGISKDKCFVHFEQGGIALFNVIEVFALESREPMKPIWVGSCAKRASNLEALRSQIKSGKCSPLPH